jgi:hypothetical protein
MRWDERTGQDVHERRFAGAVMADEPDALAGIHGEINVCKRTHGAEMLLDAVQRDGIGGCRGHEAR